MLIAVKSFNRPDEFKPVIETAFTFQYSFLTQSKEIWSLSSWQAKNEHIYFVCFLFVTISISK